MAAALGRVPDELKSGIISIAEARALGVSRDVLRGPAWRHVDWGRYRWAAQGADGDVALAVLLSSLPEGAALAGPIAARRWGIDVPRPAEPEVIVPPGAGISGRVKGNVGRVQLKPGDVVLRHGLPVTQPAPYLPRSCLPTLSSGGRGGRRSGPLRGLVRQENPSAYLARHHKTPGLVQARRVLELTEPKSESPMESPLRMLLVREGLPRPAAQVSVYGVGGAFLGRLDLYYPQARLGLEYDGGNHRDRVTADNQRPNRILEAGFHLLRYTAPDLTTRPDAVVAEVRAALDRHRRT